MICSEANQAPTPPQDTGDRERALGRFSGQPSLALPSCKATAASTFPRPKQASLSITQLGLAAVFWSATKPPSGSPHFQRGTRLTQFPVRGLHRAYET
jgi:hypothetical protein